MHGFDTIAVRSQDQGKNARLNLDWPGAKEFAAHDGSGGWTFTKALSAGPFRFRHKALPHGVSYLTMEFELPRLVRGDSNVMVPHSAQREAIEHAHHVWLSAGGDPDPVVWRLDAACDVPWPATCWPGLKEMAGRLRAARYEGTSRAETQSWDQRNKRIKMYMKEGAYARLEYHLGKAKALAEALPDKTLAGLTLLDLPALGREISRLMLLKAADLVGLWSVRREPREQLLACLMSDPELTGGGVLRLFGAVCALDLAGAEPLLASVPSSKKRSFYRLLQEVRERGLLSAEGAPAEYAEALYRDLAPLDRSKIGERLEWQGDCRALARELAAERERRKAA